MSRSLDAWFSYIEKIHDKRMDFGLDRIAVVADRLSLKKFSCPVITVAGTNGKGSCVKTLETIYAHAGYKTALYTSPHLMDFNERIRINNKNISDESLMHAFEIIENARENVVLSFFEFITLAALYLFQQANCDVIILEVGLGGRLDAVNIVESDVAVVTSIALDHMEYLGNDLESIAYEKASIARAGKFLICGEENPPENIAKTAAAKNAILLQINRDFFYKEWECEGEMEVRVPHNPTTKPMEARAQATAKLEHLNKLFVYGNDFQYDFLISSLKPQNIATAIVTIESLKNKLPVTAKNIIDGVQNTFWPGRFEIISTPFPCILDVAHNPHAAHWLAQQYSQLSPVNGWRAQSSSFKTRSSEPLNNSNFPYRQKSSAFMPEIFKNSIAVVGMLKDKAMRETVAALLPLIQTWYVCDLSSSEKERGANGSVIADFLKKQGVKNVIAFSSVSDAMDAVLQSHCQVQCDRALIFGSFYTVAAAKRWLFNH